MLSIINSTSRSVLFLSIFLSSAMQLAAADKVPSDTCVLEINTARGATLVVDGRNYGTKRRLSFGDLRQNRSYTSTLTVRFPSGHREVRKVTIEGGRLLSVAFRDPAAKLPEVVLQSGHSGNARYATFSRDGRFLLTGSDRAILWDVQTGRALRIYSGHKNSLMGVGFSQNDSRVITASLDDNLIVWDRDSGRQLNVIDTGSCYDMRVSPDGNQALVASGRDGATLWDLISGRKIRSFKNPFKGGVFEVAFDLTGNKIATVPASWKKDEKSIVLFDLATGQRLHELHGHSFPIERCEFSPGGTHLITLGRQKEKGRDCQSELILWDSITGTKLQHNKYDDTSVSGIAFDPTGKHIATCLSWPNDKNRKSQEVLLDAITLQRVRSVGEGFSIQTFAPDGKHCFTGTSYRELGNPDESRSFGGRLSSAHQVRFEGLNDSVLVNDKELVDLTSGQVVLTLKSPFENGWMSDSRFTPDRRAIITIATDRKNDSKHLVTYDGTTGAQINTFPIASDSNWVAGLSMSSDATRVLTVSSEDVILWDMITGRPIGRYGLEKYNSAGAVSPNGRTVIRQPRDDQTRAKWPLNIYNVADICDAETGKKIRTLQVSSRYEQSNKFRYYREFDALAFTPDGKTIVTGGEVYTPHTKKYGGVIFLWDSASGKLKKTLYGHPDEVTDIEVSRDGRRLVSYCDDHDVIVWDLQTGKRLFTTDAHIDSDPPSLSPDGRRLLTLTTEGTMQVWDVDSRKQLMQLVRFSKEKDKEENQEQMQDDWLAITPEGLFDGTPAARQQVSFRVGDGLNVVPVDRFYQNFYYPGLMQAIARGERPIPSHNLGDRLSPLVKIVEPSASTSEMEVTEPRVQIKALVSDRGGGIKAPWIVHNGARLLAPAAGSKTGKTQEQTFTVALVEGANTLEVHSASDDGSWESEPARLTVHYRHKVEDAQLIAICVGVSNYAEASMNLQFAAKDAQAFGDLFRTQGSKLYGKDKVHIAELTDTRGTRQYITKAFEQATKRARPQDTLVVFLAGHGAMVGQRYYFIPHDFKATNDKLEEDIRQQGIPGDVFDELVNSVPALKRVVVYDTCQSGGALALGYRTRNGFAFRGALERMARATGSFTIAATSANEDAKEIDDLGHGVLTYALLAGAGVVDAGPLKTQRLKTDGKVVEVRDWFNYAQDKVPLVTKTFLGQEQFVSSSGQGSSFPVLPVKE